MKKDLKHRLRGKKLAPDRAEADEVGESVSSSASLLRPDSRAGASGHNEEGAGISTGTSQARLRDPSPMPADEGRRDDSQRKEADVDEKEVGQRDLRPDPDAEVATGGGPAREDRRAYSPKQEPDGM